MVSAIRVKPIYGWGWSGTPHAPVEPQPFDLVIERRGPARGRVEWAIGRVASPDHSLDGLYAYLVGRNAETTGAYDIVFFVARPPLARLGDGWSAETNAMVVASGAIVIEM